LRQPAMGSSSGMRMAAFINGAALRMPGYSSEELQGQEVALIIPEEDRERHRAGFDRYLATARGHVPRGGVRQKCPARRMDSWSRCCGTCTRQNESVTTRLFCRCAASAGAYEAMAGRSQTRAGGRPWMTRCGGTPQPVSPIPTARHAWRKAQEMSH
jgi:hypothetical protein